MNVEFVILDLKIHTSLLVSVKHKKKRGTFPRFSNTGSAKPRHIKQESPRHLRQGANCLHFVSL